MFKLLKISTVNKSEDLTEVSFFKNKRNGDLSNNVVKTLILGANATGKTRFLNLMVDFFRTVYNYCIYEDFELNSLLEDRMLNEVNVIYELKNNDTTNFINVIVKIDSSLEIGQKSIPNLSMLVNGREVKKKSTMLTYLPNQVIAISFLLHDSFPFESFEVSKDKFYNYCGIKVASNNSFINTISDRLCEIILMNSLNQTFLSNFDKVFKFAGLNNKVKISYKILNRSFFGLLSKEELVIKLNEKVKIELDKTRASYRVERLNRLTEDKISDAAEFISSLEINNNELSFIINLGSEKKKDLTGLVPILNDLNSLRITGGVSLSLYEDNEFSFYNASSGQKQILYSFACILSKISDNGLIVIDEPDLSLHPNWQLKYIDLLNKVLAESSGHHVVMATHSHFMASDIDEKSSIISFKRDEEQRIKIKLLEYNTYYKSIDEILYEVFDVATTRNYYIAGKLDYIMTRLVKGEVITQDEINEVKHIDKQLNENDPMKIAIVKLLKDIERATI